MTVVQHHVPDDLLLAYAAGAQAEPVALVVATHLALCPRCRVEVERLEQAGGALLDDLGPADVSADALDAMMSRLDEPAPVERSASPSVARVLPQPLRAYAGGDLASLKFKFKAPGVAEVDLGIAWNGMPARLVRLRPGLVIPSHTHSGTEFNLVLTGGLRDNGGRHEPHVLPDEPCIALVVTAGPLVALTLKGRILAKLVGI
jgi:putative transcriptional regulator